MAILPKSNIKHLKDLFFNSSITITQSCFPRVIMSTVSQQRLMNVDPSFAAARITSSISPSSTRRPRSFLRSFLYLLKAGNSYPLASQMDKTPGRRLILEHENRLISEHKSSNQITGSVLNIETNKNTGKSHFIEKCSGKMLRPRT